MQATKVRPDSHAGTITVVGETDDIVAVCLNGEFDIANTAALVEEIDRALLDKKHLIIDLSDATFIDSTVINALFHAAKAARAEERTVILQLGTEPIVERLIEITGIEQVLSRVSARADAVQIIEEASYRPPRSPRWGIPARPASSVATVGGTETRDR